VAGLGNDAVAHPLHDGAATVRRCAATATAFLATLDAPGRAQAAWPFSDEYREAWSYRAGSAFRKQGRKLADMSDTERRLVHQLLHCGLSAQGYLKTTGIVRLDDEVGARANQIVMYDGKGPIEMGAGFFWTTLFGAPGSGKPWGFQFEGHHLALNFTMVGEEMAVTPAFWGAWPAVIESGPFAGQSLLGVEERAGFELLGALDGDQRARAVLSSTLPPGIFTSPERKTALTRFEGLPGSALDAGQLAMLRRLLDTYVGNFAPDVAGEWLDRIEREGLSNVHFAWMGPTEPGRPVYYRVHGPSVLIEFDHAINITSKQLEPDPNHIHTILRRPGSDLGEDLLARHYAESAEHTAEP
jgi:hypothetical protein